MNNIRLFLIFLKLGLTSFGGPVAHIAFFKQEFVQRRGWLNAEQYASLVALCQFIPGPASSQVGLMIGQLRGGYLGAFAAWAGFTLPSALLLAIVGLGIVSGDIPLSEGVLSGLKTAALSVVLLACWQMYRSLCQGALGHALLITGLLILTSTHSGWWPFIIIIGAGLISWKLHTKTQNELGALLPHSISKRSGLVWALFLGVLLVTLPFMTAQSTNPQILLMDATIRAGSFVFGGGHVVLPLLQNEFVVTGLTDSATFTAGYGLTQAVPGPLFTFSAFLGAVSSQSILGAALALMGIFIPAVCLVFAAYPFWTSLQRQPSLQRALTGINAAVVAILFSAVIDPIWPNTISSGTDLILLAVIVALLVSKRLPIWGIVLLSGGLGWLWY